MRPLSAFVISGFDFLQERCASVFGVNFGFGVAIAVVLLGFTSTVVLSLFIKALVDDLIGYLKTRFGKRR